MAASCRKRVPSEHLVGTVLADLAQHVSLDLVVTLQVFIIGIQDYIKSTSEYLFFLIL
jgi:hypothetical protein